MSRFGGLRRGKNAMTVCGPFCLYPSGEVVLRGFLRIAAKGEV